MIPTTQSTKTFFYSRILKDNNKKYSQVGCILIWAIWKWEIVKETQLACISTYTVFWKSMINRSFSISSAKIHKWAVKLVKIDGLWGMKKCL